MKTKLQLRFRIFPRNVKGQTVFYCEDVQNGKQYSLRTKDKTEAKRLLGIKNEAHENRENRLQSFNSKVARLYMLASDPRYTERTWGYVLDTIVKQKQGETRDRWERVKADDALSHIWSKPIITTSSDELLAAMNEGKVSTNIFLRRLQNYAMDMGWIPEPIIAKRNWPKVRFKEKRAITSAEQKRIIDREKNPERRAYYELCWFIGASQGDVADLDASCIDWNSRVLTYYRKKLKNKPNSIPAKLKIGESTAAVLKALPTSGPLFPNLRLVRASDRATEFKQRCDGLNITGITLHSYRYAWAERSANAGYPERFAQGALGHNSKAVHRFYAKKADPTLPALEDYERDHRAKIIPMTPNSVQPQAIPPLQSAVA